MKIVYESKYEVGDVVWFEDTYSDPTENIDIIRSYLIYGRGKIKRVYVSHGGINYEVCMDIAIKKINPKKIIPPRRVEKFGAREFYTGIIEESQIIGKSLYDVVSKIQKNHDEYLDNLREAVK
jgi:hypothetical protein